MGAAPEEVGVSSRRLERLTRLLHRYVDEGRIPGASMLVSRRGEVVYRDVYGMADIARGTKLRDDTIFRIYSMTKPIASVAAMTLYEEGRLLLEDPVSRYVPSFADVRVFARGDDRAYSTEPAMRPVTIRHLLTHASGISAWFQPDPVAAIYRSSGLVRGGDESLEEHVDRMAGMPLLFQPGTRFHYGSSTDVLGRVIEVVADRPLDAFLAERVFEPLGMSDTAFWVRDAELDRFCANYSRPRRDLVEIDPSTAESTYARPPKMLSAAGGLVSTVDDYHRFTRMLLGGGELDGTRVIGPRTVAFMTHNHLPGGVDLNAFGQDTFAEVAMDGVGFGLGFAVVLDPATNQSMTSVGEYSWGGMASTAFWVDPTEELIAIFMTQLVPSARYPIRRQLRAAVYQALVD